MRRSGAGGLVTWRAHDRVSLIGGIDYEDERQSGTSEFSASYGTFPDSIAVQRNTTGYFTQATMIVGRSVVMAGGRLDDNSQFGSHGTYRVGLVYSLAADTRQAFDNMEVVLQAAGKSLDSVLKVIDEQ